MTDEKKKENGSFALSLSPSVLASTASRNHNSSYQDIHFYLQYVRREISSTLRQLTTETDRIKSVQEERKAAPAEAASGNKAYNSVSKLQKNEEGCFSLDKALGGKRSCSCCSRTSSGSSKRHQRRPSLNNNKRRLPTADNGRFGPTTTSGHSNSNCVRCRRKDESNFTEASICRTSFFNFPHDKISAVASCVSITPKFHPIPPPRKRNVNEPKRNISTSGHHTLSEVHLVSNNLPLQISSRTDFSIPSTTASSSSVGGIYSARLFCNSERYLKSSAGSRYSQFSSSRRSSYSVESLGSHNQSSTARNATDMTFNEAYSKNTTAVSTLDRAMSTSASSFNYVNGHDDGSRAGNNVKSNAVETNSNHRSRDQFSPRTSHDRFSHTTSRDSYELDFRSTESVNSWLNHILAELNSLPSSSPPTIRRRRCCQKKFDEVNPSSRSQEYDSALGSSSLVTSSNDFLTAALTTSSIGDDSCGGAEGTFFRACSELRDIGRLTACGHSGGKNDFLRHKTSCHILDSTNKNDSAAVRDNRSSYTWPLEMLKSSSGSLTTNNDNNEEAAVVVANPRADRREAFSAVEAAADDSMEPFEDLLNDDVDLTATANFVRRSLGPESSIVTVNDSNFFRPSKAVAATGLSFSSPNLESKRRHGATIKDQQDHSAHRSVLPVETKKQYQENAPFVADVVVMNTKVNGAPPPVDVIHGEEDINFCVPSLSSERTFCPGRSKNTFSSDFCTRGLNQSVSKAESLLPPNSSSSSSSIRNVVARIIKLAENEISGVSRSTNALKKICGHSDNNFGGGIYSTTTTKMNNDSPAMNHRLVYASVVDKKFTVPNNQYYRLPPEQQQQQQSTQDCRDACTQTTPVSLSRSTSLTCCMSSDDEIESGDEEVDGVGDGGRYVVDDDDADDVITDLDHRNRCNKNDNESKNDVILQGCPLTLLHSMTSSTTQRGGNNLSSSSTKCPKIARVIMDSLPSLNEYCSMDGGTNSENSPDAYNRIFKSESRFSTATTDNALSLDQQHRKSLTRVKNQKENNSQQEQTFIYTNRSVEILDESLNLLLESALSDFHPIKKHSDKNNSGSTFRVSNFSDALKLSNNYHQPLVVQSTSCLKSDECGSKLDKCDRLRSSATPSCISDCTAQSEEQFIAKFVKQHLPSSSNIDNDNKLKLYWQEDKTVYDNLSSYLSNASNNITNDEGTIGKHTVDSCCYKKKVFCNRKPPLADSFDSPDSSASDFLISEKMPSLSRELSLADDEASPLADSESSPVLDKVNLAQCFLADTVTECQQNQQKISNPATAAATWRPYAMQYDKESSSSMIQPAPEFQYKNPEDYERECMKKYNNNSKKQRCGIESASKENENALSLMDGENCKVSPGTGIIRRGSHDPKVKFPGHAPFLTATSGLTPSPSSMAGSLPALHQLKESPDHVGLFWRGGSKKSCVNLMVTNNNPVEARSGKSSIHKVAAEKTSRQCCRWLRAAGFPQYAKLYEDKQFPIDLDAVKKDHAFLDADSLRALFRRLHVLNECAYFSVDVGQRSNKKDDESDDDQLPLSHRWKFVRKSRTWSRVDYDEFDTPTSNPVAASVAKVRGQALCCPDSRHSTKSSHSRDCVFVRTGEPVPISEVVSTDHGMSVALEDVELSSLKVERRTTALLQRSQSERIKDKAKAFVKRMDFRNHQKRRKSPFVDKGATARDSVVCVIKEQPLPPPPAPAPVAVSRPQLLVDSNLVDENVVVKLRSVNNNSNTNTFANFKTKNNNNNRVVPLKTSLDYYLNFSRSPMDDAIDYANSTTDAFAGESAMRQSDKRKGRVFLKQILHRSPIESGNKNVNSSSAHEIPTVPNTNFHPYAELNNKLCYENREYSSSSSQLLGSSLININNNTSNNNGESRSNHYRHVNLPMYSRNDKNVIDFDQKYVDTNSFANNNVDSSLKVDIVDATHSSGGGAAYCMSSNSRQQLHSSSSDDNNDNSNLFYWERRDSGVGSSLSRSPSAPVKQRAKWHSFQQQRSHHHHHHPDKFGLVADIGIHSLTLTQFVTLQKYALLKLTALMEKYSPSMKPSGWQFGVQKLLKRIKHNDQKIAHENQIFGVSLCTIAQRTGHPLPQCILHAMRFLRKQSADTVGIFRKPGVRSRIQNVRNQFESFLAMEEFDAQQTYDVADTVKQYFRELPEPLLTSKLSETFIGIFLNVPEHLRLEAVQSAVLLLPDENRETLQTLIHFLHDVSSFSDVNQMTAKNLAVCFAPTLFQQSTRNAAMSPQRRHKTITGGLPNEKELSENRAAQACLTAMIEQRTYIFMVPRDIMIRCSYSFTEREEPANIYELGLPQGNYLTYLKGCMDVLLQENRDRWKGWVIEGSCDGVEMSSKKVDDGHPLKLWRVWTDVEAPPRELLFRVLAERDSWDEDIMKWRVVHKLSDSCDILQYICNDMPPHPTRDFCVVRKWLTDVLEIKGGCIVTEASVNSPEVPQIGGIRGVCFASRYLIEPIGAGKSRINHVVRMDLKGRSKSYYRKIFGYLCANQLARIRNSFRQISGGPETKV